MLALVVYGVGFYDVETSTTNTVIAAIFVVIFVGAVAAWALWDRRG